MISNLRLRVQATPNTGSRSPRWATFAEPPTRRCFGKIVTSSARNESWWWKRYGPEANPKEPDDYADWNKSIEGGKGYLVGESVPTATFLEDPPFEL